MTTTPDLESKVKALKDVITPLTAQLRELEYQLSKEKSCEFIRVNQITRDQVNSSKAAGLPYFGVVWNFAKHLAQQPTRKPWTEWNDRVYRTSDLIDGYMPTGTSALWEDVP